ncbi:MAG: DNA polymerase III subunit gamma/tau [Candidatus Lambdaproteobacteria bacterium]|nr:DNA polymerase III subunit gamma/tau [Candidatus Lambdaproteobacteria bacterium]
MEYVVLARKLRPNRFQDLVGQDVVARILRAAVRTGRVAHAYLFTGSRGVGKTSTARILTKALNCLNPEEGEPCNACANCSEITANASPDVYEIDAASNRGIDNIRELRENTRYAPAKSRYKTYIIDEVHMLTPESFNALLKTLEEPPEHIKFILATTSPHKIPETVLSRCQRFDFPRIPVAVMVEYLQRVCAQEGLKLSRSALEAVARNAAGGMRDALTALDQVVAYAGQEVGDEQVLRLLGLMDTREVLALLGAVLARDLPAALGTFRAIVEHGHDLQVLLEALLRDTKDLALAKVLAQGDAYFQDHPPEALEFFAARREAHSLDVVQQLFYLFLELEGQLKRSEFPRSCFEMALVKACRVEPLVGVPDLLAEVREHLKAPAFARGGRAPESAAEAQAARATRPAAPRQSRTASGTAARAERGADRAPAPAEPEPAAEPAPAYETGPPDVEMPPLAAYESEGEAEPAPFPRVPRAAPTGADERVRPQAVRAAPGAPRPPRAGSEPVAAPAENAPPAPEEETPARDPAALLAEPALCEDPRWQAAVAAVQEGGQRRLAADLRGTEVAAIDEGGGEKTIALVPPRAAFDFTAAERAALDGALAQAFGAGFRHRRIDDTTRTARPEQTLAGRQRLTEEVRRAAERAAALADPAVGAIRRAFPGSRIVSAEVGAKAGGDMGDDTRAEPHAGPSAREP